MSDDDDGINDGLQRNQSDSGITILPLVRYHHFQNLSVCRRIPIRADLNRMSEAQKVSGTLINLKPRKRSDCWDPIDLIFYRERAQQPARMKRKRNRRRVESGGRPADVACLHPIKADPLPPVTHDPRRFGAAYTPLPPSQQPSMACDATCSSGCMRQPRPFRHSSLMATPTRSQGGSFERGDQNEQLSPSQLFDQSSRS